jgi:arginase family enzyme
LYQRADQPYYAGLNTFFRAPTKDFNEVTAGEVAVLGVPMDFATSARTGGRWGPDAIRRESLYLAAYYHLGENELLDVPAGVLTSLPKDPRICDVGDANIYPTDLQKQTTSIIGAVRELSARGAFPVVLGGDHYIAYPSFEGFAAGYLDRHPAARFGYLHIDSHTDFIDEITFLGRYNHGTSARRVSENSNIARMAFVGINWPGAMHIDQYQVMRDRGFVIYPSTSIRERGIERVMRDAFEVLDDGTDAIYVSVDIDAVDAAYAPGTHSHVFDGMTARDFLDAMNIIASNPKVQAIDLCEVLPSQDSSHRTERLAAAALLLAISPRILDYRKADASLLGGQVFR